MLKKIINLFLFQIQKLNAFNQNPKEKKIIDLSNRIFVIERDIS
jgi:hypothetical protein